MVSRPRGSISAGVDLGAAPGDDAGALRFGGQGRGSRRAGAPSILPFGIQGSVELPYANAFLFE